MFLLTPEEGRRAGGLIRLDRIWKFVTRFSVIGGGLSLILQKLVLTQSSEPRDTSDEAALRASYIIDVLRLKNG